MLFHKQYLSFSNQMTHSKIGGIQAKEFIEELINIAESHLIPISNTKAIALEKLEFYLGIGSKSYPIYKLQMRIFLTKRP